MEDGAMWLQKKVLTADAWLIDRVFQRISDRCREVTGKNNFWLARVFAWPGLVLVSFLTACDFLTGIAFFAIMWAVIGLMYFKLLSVLEKQEKRWDDEYYLIGSANPLRLTYLMSRMLAWLLFVCMTAYTVLNFRLGTSLVIDYFGLSLLAGCSLIPFSYFASCTPKPPSKLRTSAKLAVSRI